MAMKSIHKKKMKDEIRENIQNAILSGEIKPGDRLVETRMAADMGVSQAPVREALKELEHMGLVESRPYQGTYVKELTRKDVRDNYDARLLLELYAVKLAAQLITEEQLATLRALLEEMNDAAQEGSVSRFVEYDVLFHQAIIEAGGNRMIGQLWQLANVSLMTHVTTNLSSRSLDNLAHRHRDVYQTLAAHDVEGAHHAMEVHLVELRDELSERIE